MKEMEKGLIPWLIINDNGIQYFLLNLEWNPIYAKK